MQKNTQKLLTVSELEAFTGRMAPTWRRAIAKGKIPVVRIGRSVRVPFEAVEHLIREDIREWIKNH